MNENDFTNAFSDCIDRLNQGESLENCLRLYPQYAAELRPLLMAGLDVRTMRADARTVVEARARAREAFLAALVQPAPVRRRYPSALALVASLILVTAVVLGVSVLREEPRLQASPTAPLPSATITVTASPTPTVMPSATPTPTSTPSALPSPTATQPALSATSTVITPAAESCTPQAPEGWITYTITSGDTLSGIAASGGTDLETLMTVNCLEDAGLILAGQTLYVPPETVSGQSGSQPPSAGAPAPQPGGASGSSTDGGVDGSGDTDNDDGDNDDDDDGDENDGDDGDDDDDDD